MSYNEDFKVLDRRIKGLSNEKLTEMYDWYFDGCEEAVWPMEQFTSWLSEEQLQNEIKLFNDNNIHFDRSESFVSQKYGSSNSRENLMDIPALFKAIVNDEDDTFMLKEDLEQWRLEEGLYYL